MFLAGGRGNGPAGWWRRGRTGQLSLSLALPLSLRVFKHEHSVCTLNTDCSNCVQTVFKREHSVFTVFTQSEQAVFKHEPSSATMVLNLEALPQKEDKAVESLRPRDEASLQKAHCYVQVRQALARLLP